MIAVELNLACAARSPRVDAVIGGLAFCLPLAAAPAYAMMAALTVFHGGSGPMPLCSSGGDLFGGMAPMYLLMSLFHCTRWLRWIGGRWSAITLGGTSTGCESRSQQ